MLHFLIAANPHGNGVMDLNAAGSGFDGVQAEAGYFLALGEFEDGLTASHHGKVVLALVAPAVIVGIT